MTTYHLDLSERADVPGERDRTIAALATEDKAVMAATLRAAADRLDPPQPPRPVQRRGASGPIDFDDPALRGAVVRVEPWMRRQAADQRFREKLAGYGDQATGNAYDAQCRGNDCNEGHTYLAGCALWQGATEIRNYQHAVNDGNEIDTPAGRMTPSRIDVHFRDGRFERLVAIGTRRPMGKGARIEAEWTPNTVDGSKPLPGDLRHLIKPPTYAHTPDCNTIHDGPTPCPPPRPAVRRNLVTPDGCGSEHTEAEGCALWRGPRQ